MLMKLSWKILAALAVLCGPSVQAQSLVYTWTYNASQPGTGLGLDPATYGGQFRPAELIPDMLTNSQASIALSGLTSGGLGSSGSGAYGGLYTLFSSGAAFDLQVNTILDGVDEISITFLAGGGFPTLVEYDASSLVLDFNLGNPALAATSFNTVTGIIVSTPIGDQNLTQYTWTWTGLSALGPTTEFSTSWNAQGQQHVFYTDFSVTQVVPEPSVLGLIALGGVVMTLRRKRKNAH